MRIRVHVSALEILVSDIAAQVNWFERRMTNRNFKLEEVDKVWGSTATGLPVAALKFDA